MEREARPSMAVAGWSGARRSRGAAIVEAVIALPILLAVILGAIQFGFIYQAKATLNFAGLQAARAGAVGNAQPEAIRSGLARGLAPLYSPESSVEGVASAIARINAELLQDARIRILNPTREAFEDFGEEVEGVREIPNDRLHARDTTVGALSGINIQDANLLRVEITYGYELKVPLINRFITRILQATRRAGRMDAFELQLLRRGFLPIVTTSTVRMQSPARMSDAVAARGDLPDIDRIPSDARPPDDTEESGEDEEEAGGDSGGGDDEGSTLADGFFGFGEGSGDGSGGGASPGNGGGNGGGGSGGGSGGGGGGGNSGSPAQCDAGGGGGSNPFPSDPMPPGDSSPVPGPPRPPLFETSESPGASLPGVTLPSLSVGNPIHVVTGNKYQREIDLPAMPGPLGLAFVRHYNSEATGRAGALGAGWRHGYEASIEASAEGDSIDLWQADGRRLKFRKSASGVYRPQRGGEGEVLSMPDGYRWRWASGRELDFDRAGKLMHMREGRGRISFVHDERERLERIVDSQGRTLAIEYYANGRIAKVVVANKTWHYFYDDVGNLAQVVAPDARARRYEYKDPRHPHHLTDISAGRVKPADYGRSNEFVAIAHWEYDAIGRGVLSTHPDNAGKVTLSYGDGYTDVTDAFGRVTRYVTAVRNGVALVTEVRGPGCGACGQGNVAFEFDEHFQLTRQDNRDTPDARFHYDDQQRLVSVEHDNGEGFEVEVAYEYQSQSMTPSRVRRPSVKPGASHEIEFNYRDDGQVSSIHENGFAPTDEGTYRSIERSFAFAYGATGELVSIDGPRSDVSDITRFEYDSAGRFVATRSAEGIEHRIDEFSAAGHPVRISRTGLPDIRVDYDEQDRVLSITELRSAGERKIRYSYDAVGRLETITDADGRVQRIAYDAAGRPSRLSADDSGLSALLKYATDGSVVAAGVLDRKGLLVRGIRNVYDDQRRLIEIRDGSGPPVRQFSYTDDERVPTLVTDSLGRSTRFSYDVSGEVESVSAPDAGITHFVRDDARRMTEVRAPNGALTVYSHDDFGRRVSENSADTGATRNTFDVAGNLTGQVRANGEWSRYAYDADNRLTGIQRREGSTRFVYRKNQLAEIVEPQGGEAFEYDRDGQVVKHVRRLGRHILVTEQQWDAAGRISLRTLPSGARLRYRYTSAGKLQAIAREDTFAAVPIVDSEQQKSVDPMGAIRFGNGHTLTNRYDASTGRLMRRSMPGIREAKYSYDESNRLTNVDDRRQKMTYGYDAADRLVLADTQASSFRYAYDESGNRLSEKRKGVAGSLAYASGSNHLTSASRGNKELYEHDASGNPLRIGKRRYEYTSDGRPARLFIDEHLVAAYRYDSVGRRISKTRYDGPSPQTAFYIYEKHQLLAEADARGSIQREYIYLGHHPVAVLEKGSIYWIHTDHLGTPVAATDEDRRIVWQADYEPFGRAHLQEDPDKDGRRFTLNLRFPGQYADGESGTHYNLMRDYDPNTGRYLTPDPLGLFDGTNRFAYAGGNPISRVDPFGLYLFAFDGTWVNRSSGTLTNVELFRRYYDPTVDEQNSFYRRGVGTPDEDASGWSNSVDRVFGGATGLGGQDMIDAALERLDDLISGTHGNGAFDGVIDIVGFSRGAAIGRAFANEVYSRIDAGYYRNALVRGGTCRSVRIRFMGLFDTVAAFGIPTNATNLGYDLTIDTRVGSVAHAIALNEHRAAFDLISIQDSEHAANTSPYRQERGFIGAHSDIGGGYHQGDLSDLTLRWMHVQASAAGVSMARLSSEHLTITAPIVHDERRYLSQDREIFYPNDPDWERETCSVPSIQCALWEPPATQRQFTAPQFQFPELGDMIRESRQPDAVRGRVDIEEYRYWLRSRGLL